MGLFGKSNVNPYKEHPVARATKDRIFWTAVFVTSVIAAIGFFGQVLSYHPTVQSVYNNMADRVSLPNLMDKRKYPCKIAIVSVCHSPLCPKFHGRAMENHAAYAQLHGYDYISDHRDLVEHNKPVEWVVLRLLERWLPHYDYVLVIDPASLFMNGDIKIEENFDLPNEGSWEMYVAHHQEGILAKSLFVKSTARMLQLVKDLYAHYGKFQYFPDVGGAIDYFMKERGLSTARFVSFKTFHSQGRDHGFHSPVWQAQQMYQDGDWLVKDGYCGWGMENCDTTEIFDLYWNKLTAGQPITKTIPPVSPLEGQQQCHPVTIDAHGYGKLSLLKRELTPKFVLSKLSIHGGD